MTECDNATPYAPRMTRRFLLVGGPLVFAGLTLLHPQYVSHELGDAVGQWLVVHALQLVLSVLLAYSVWILLDGLAGLLSLTVATYRWDRHLRLRRPADASKSVASQPAGAQQS